MVSLRQNLVKKEQICLEHHDWVKHCILHDWWSQGQCQAQGHLPDIMIQWSITFCMNDEAKVNVKPKVTYLTTSWFSEVSHSAWLMKPRSKSGPRSLTWHHDSVKYHILHDWWSQGQCQSQGHLPDNIMIQWSITFCMTDEAKVKVRPKVTGTHILLLTVITLHTGGRNSGGTA